MRRITVDLGRTVKFGGDRTDLDAHLAVNNAGAGITGYGRSREAPGDRRHVREEVPHLLDRMMDNKALVERRLRREIGRNILANSKRVLRLPASSHVWNRTNGSIPRVSTVTMIATRGPERGPAGPRNRRDAAGPSIRNDAADRIDDADISGAAT